MRKRLFPVAFCFAAIHLLSWACFAIWPELWMEPDKAYSLLAAYIAAWSMEAK